MGSFSDPSDARTMPRVKPYTNEATILPRLWCPGWKAIVTRKNSQNMSGWCGVGEVDGVGYTVIPFEKTTMDGLWLEVWVGFFWRSENFLASKAVCFSLLKPCPCGFERVF